MEEYLLSLENKLPFRFDGKLFCFNIDDLHICQKVKIDTHRIIPPKYGDCYKNGQKIGRLYCPNCGFGRFSSSDKNEVIIFIIGFLSTLKSTR